MLSALSATEVAFLMAAVIQAVAAVVWALGAWVARDERPAATHWAAYAALSSLTWAILAMRLESPPLIGILVGVLAAIALQRGIRLFIGRAPLRVVPLVQLGLVLLAAWAAPRLEARHLQATVNFAVLAWLFLMMAHDLHVHARDDLDFRWPILLTLPVLLGGLGFGSRALRALVWPDSVAQEMSANSALNIGSALGYVVLVLALHATLMALVVARLLRALHRLSRHDGLTGLLNRRAMQEALEAQLQRSHRSGEAFAVMMLDLDHFKSINDRYGHAVGDLALKQVSASLRSQLRDVDSLARFGGEEFLVLLPGLATSQVAPVAERLRETVSAGALDHAGSPVSLGISVGVAEWCGPAEDLSRLLVRADAALYQAKSQGRGRVVMALQEPALRAQAA